MQKYLVIHYDNRDDCCSIHIQGFVCNKYKKSHSKKDQVNTDDSRAEPEVILSTRFTL